MPQTLILVIIELGSHLEQQQRQFDATRELLRNLLGLFSMSFNLNSHLNNLMVRMAKEEVQVVER